MNIAENLQLLQQTKEDIYQAIIAVGGELEASAPFSAYPEAILALSGDTPTPTPEPTSAVTISSVQDPAFRIDYSDINTGITDCKIGISTSSAMTWDDWSSNNYAYANTHTSSSARSWQMNLGLSRGTFGVERASDDSQQSLQNKLSLKTLSAGTWYVKVWVSYDDWATASAITPVVEVVPPPEPDEPSEIPEGLHKFTISESQWPDCAMMVEAFYNPDKLRKGETGSQTVNIYEDPNGEPVNTIAYNGYVIGGETEVDVQNSDFNAGVYCSNLNDWSPYISNPLAFKLECRTAGTYYIEVVDHANPKFYDVNGIQIYPDNAQ